MMLMSTGRPRRTIAAAAALALSGTLAACGGGGSGGGGAGGVLTVSAGAGGNFVRNFNPYAPQPLQPTNEMIYEPLFHFNAARTGEVDPWLATKYTWADGGKSIRIQLRKNVTWNDGKPFTAEDVAYTFRMTKDNKALNMYALPVASATAE